MEDILTSCVFGILRYLPPEQGLLPFLAASEAVCGDPHELNMLGGNVHVSYMFWPQLEELGSIEGGDVQCKFCEPDVLLEIRRANGKLVYALVEAKLNSGKSSGAGEDLDVPNDQLAREWDNLVCLCAKDGAEPLLIYLTADFSVPIDDIRQSELEYRQKRPGNRFSCSWLSWRQIPRIFRSAPEIDELQDLVKLCERLNLRYFDRTTYFESLPDVSWRFERAGAAFRWRVPEDAKFDWRFEL